MAIETGKAAGAGRMACSAFSIGALVVNRECVIEIGRKPTRRTVAIGALAGKMVGRPAIKVAALAIGSSGKLMIEGSRPPDAGGMAGRALSSKMVGWAAIDMTALAICRASHLMVERGRAPGTGSMAGRTLSGEVIGRSF